MQRKLFKSISIAALVAGLGLAAAAFAGGAEGCPMHGGHHMDPAKMEARFVKHHAELKEKLKLRPEQEAAWSAFGNAMKPEKNPGHKNHREMRAELDQLPTPQRVDRMQAMADQHHAGMVKRNEAVKAFYATLTPEQQKVFDAQAKPSAHHGKRQHHD